MSSTQKTYDSNGGAVWAGIRDLNDRSDPPYDALEEGDRLEGRTVLLTGASSGLGLAVAKECASRGARVLMVCRRDASEELEAVRRAARLGGHAEGLRADMADFASIHALVDDLAARKVRIDVVISNAAVVPGSARTTVDGLEEMLQVNALAPALLIRRLLEAGLVPNDTHAGNGVGAGSPATRRPRIVIVASEAHRSADGLHLDRLRHVEPYGMAESTARYGWTKLLLLTYARELGRRLDGGGTGAPDVAVHALCPGPVASNIAREVPAIVRPLTRLFFRIFFQSPETAARPVVYLAASPRIDGRTGTYQFLMRRRPPSDLADAPESGRALWSAFEEILAGSSRRSA